MLLRLFSLVTASIHGANYKIVLRTSVLSYFAIIPSLSSSLSLLHCGMLSRSTYSMYGHELLLSFGVRGPSSKDHFLDHSLSTCASSCLLRSLFTEPFVLSYLIRDQLIKCLCFVWLFLRPLRGRLYKAWLATGSYWVSRDCLKDGRLDRMAWPFCHVMPCPWMHLRTSIRETI